MTDFFDDVAKLGLVCAIQCAGYDAKCQRDIRRFRRETERRIREIEHDREWREKNGIPEEEPQETLWYKTILSPKELERSKEEKKILSEEKNKDDIEKIAAAYFKNTRSLDEVLDFLKGETDI